MIVGGGGTKIGAGRTHGPAGGAEEGCQHQETFTAATATAWALLGSSPRRPACAAKVMSGAGAHPAASGVHAAQGAAATRGSNPQSRNMRSDECGASACLGRHLCQQGRLASCASQGSGVTGGRKFRAAAAEACPVPVGGARWCSSCSCPSLHMSAWHPGNRWCHYQVPVASTPCPEHERAESPPARARPLGRARVRLPAAPVPRVPDPPDQSPWAQTRGPSQSSVGPWAAQSYRRCAR